MRRRWLHRNFKEGTGVVACLNINVRVGEPLVVANWSMSKPKLSFARFLVILKFGTRLGEHECYGEARVV